MNHRKLLSSALAVALALTVGTADASAPEFTLKIGTVAPGGTPWAKQLKRLKKRVKKDSEGRIKVKLYLGGKLGSEASLVRRCQKGSVGAIAVSNGALGVAVPELFATELPYLFDSHKQAYKALDAATPLVSEILAEKGFIFYIWGENGFRHFATKDKPISSPGDLKGVKMRSQPAMPHVEMYKALGAGASPIAVGEVTSSLANNVVTGYDNTLLYSFATQWHKEIKYVALSRHIYQAAVVIWCKRFFEDLPDDLQKVLMTIPPGELDKGRKSVRVMNQRLVDVYKAEGITINALSAGQIKAFKKATAAVESKFMRSTSAKGKALLKALKAAR